MVGGDLDDGQAQSVGVTDPYLPQPPGLGDRGPHHVDPLGRQVVVGPNGSETRYSTWVDGGRVELSPGRLDDADVTITEDYDTAAALARGETTPQDAILAGKVRVSGDLGALLRGQAVLERMRTRFDDVRARTEY